MDWDAYAEDFRSYSNDLLRNSRHFRQEQQGQDMRRSQEYTSYEPEQLGRNLVGPTELMESPPHVSNNIVDINRNISEIKTVYGKVNRKIGTLESMIRDCGQLLDSTNESQINIISRLDQIEHEVTNSIQSSSLLAKERSELVLHTKQLISRLGSIELHVREIESQYTAKDAFSKFLDSTVGQLGQLRNKCEVSVSKSTQAASLVEGFALALFELSGGHSGHGLKLDFLSSMVGDSRNLAQIVGLLIDSLKGAISTECRFQVNSAAEEMTNTIRPITEGLRFQVSAIAKEYQNAIISMKTNSTELDDFKKILQRFDGILAGHDSSIHLIQRGIQEFSLENVKSLITSVNESQEKSSLLLRKLLEESNEELRTQKKKVSILMESVEDQERRFKAFSQDNESVQKSMSNRMREMEELFNSKMSQLDRLVATNASQSESIDKLQKEVEYLRGKTNDLTSELTDEFQSFDKKLAAALEARRQCESADDKMASLDSRVEGLELRTKDMHESITEEMQALRAIVTTASKSASAMQANSQAMITTVIANLKESIMSSVNQQYAEAREDVDKKLLTLLGEVVTMVNESKKSISDSGILPRLSSLEHKHTEVENKLAAAAAEKVSTALTAASEDNTRSGSQYRAEDIDDIQKEMTMLHNAQAQLSDAQDEFSSSLGKLLRQVSVFSDNLESKEQSIASVREAVEQITSKMAADEISERLNLIDSRFERIESTSKLAMDALQEEIISLSSKLESIGNCDDEGCGLALNCESKIEALTATISSLQTFVNSSWKSSLATKQQTASSESGMNIPPPPPPIHPSLMQSSGASSAAKSKLSPEPALEAAPVVLVQAHSAIVVKERETAQDRGQSHVGDQATRAQEGSRLNPSDVLTSLLQPSLFAGSSQSVHSKDDMRRNNILSQLKSADGKEETADKLQVLQSRKQTDDKDISDSENEEVEEEEEEEEEEVEDDEEEDEESDNDGSSTDGKKHQRKEPIVSANPQNSPSKQKIMSTIRASDIDDSFDAEEDDDKNDDDGEDSGSDEEESESESSTEERIYGGKRPFQKSSPKKHLTDAKKELSERLDAEHDRAKQGAAARTLTPLTETAALTSKPILSGSLQRGRAVNSFPAIESNTATSSPSMFGSYPLPSGSLTSKSAGDSAKDQPNAQQFGMNSYNRNQPPIYQTLAAMGDSVTQPEAASSAASSNAKASSAPLSDKMSQAEKIVPTSMKRDERNEDDDQDEDDDEEEEDEEENSDVAEDDDSEEDDSEEEEDDSNSESEEETNTKPPHRPPINDPAALTRAAALRTLSLSNNNVPIGTKLTATSPSAAAGTPSMFSSASPRNSVTNSGGAPPPGPSLSALANIGGVPYAGSMSPSNSARSASPMGNYPAPPLLTSPGASASGKGVQCAYCLRRIPQVDITIHTSTCDFRPEQCKFGCGAKVMYIKLNQHYETCPHRFGGVKRAPDPPTSDDDDAVADAKVPSTSSSGPNGTMQLVGIGAKKVASPGKSGKSNPTTVEIPDIDDVVDFDSEGDDHTGPEEVSPSPAAPPALAPKAPSQAIDSYSFERKVSPPKKLQPLNTGPTARSGVHNNPLNDDLDSSFESSSESLDALWAIAEGSGDKDGEGSARKPRRKKTPSSLSVLQQERALSSTNARHAVNVLTQESDETDDSSSASVSSFMQSERRSNKLTDKIKRGVATMYATEKVQHNEDY